MPWMTLYLALVVAMSGGWGRRLGVPRRLETEQEQRDGIAKDPC